MTLSPEVEARLWPKIDRTEGCWEWTGAFSETRGQRYGQFRVGDKVKRAHRIVYEVLVGPIPEGMELDHLCRNTLCVNPQHLEPVTTQENVLRGQSVVADHARSSACPKGHPYEETTWQGRKVRACRQCARERSAAWRQAHPDYERQRSRRRR